MTQTIAARFDGNVFVPDGPVDLPVGQALTLRVELAADADEVARLGHARYTGDILPRLRSEDHGKFVAVDVATGDYEIDADENAAGMRLVARCPLERIWMECVGGSAAGCSNGVRIGYMA